MLAALRAVVRYNDMPRMIEVRPMKEYDGVDSKRSTWRWNVHGPDEWTDVEMEAYGGSSGGAVGGTPANKASHWRSKMINFVRIRCHERAGITSRPVLSVRVGTAYNGSVGNEQKLTGKGTAMLPEKRNVPPEEEEQEDELAHETRRRQSRRGRR